MTYATAKAAGYKDGDIESQRGYVSRKVNPDEQPVLTANGSRKGQLYVLLPSKSSTQYCYRQYLIPPTK